MNKKLISIILLLLLIILPVSAYMTGVFNNNSVSEINIDTGNLEKEDNVLVNSQTSLEKKLFETNNHDVNALLLSNNSSLKLSNSLINKTGDSNDNGDNVDFYGTNAAILVKKDSQLEFSNSEIFSNSSGSNAVFVTNAESNNESLGGSDFSIQSMNSNNQASPDNQMMGNDKGNGKPPEIPDGNGQEAVSMSDENVSGDNENYAEGGATAIIDNVKIETYKDKSRGLDATYGGKINASKIVVNTRGGSCAAVATDRGEGTIYVENSQLNTGVDNQSGRGSPCIYSTGNITVINSQGTAYNSQIACIEGKNSITLDKCQFNCFATGNRENNGQFVDLGGIFIYQSMSGDAIVGTATFNASESDLSIDSSSEYYSTAPMIHVTNTKSEINLDNCRFNFGSNVFLNVSGQDQWGVTGSNGGVVSLSLNNEKINGDIFVDEISSLNITLNDSDYTGSVNSKYDYGNISVTISDNSNWVLTGNCHVSSLYCKGNIDYGDYTLYVGDTAYNSTNPYKT